MITLHGSGCQRSQFIARTIGQEHKNTNQSCISAKMIATANLQFLQDDSDCSFSPPNFLLIIFCLVLQWSQHSYWILSWTCFLDSCFPSGYSTSVSWGVRRWWYIWVQRRCWILIEVKACCRPSNSVVTPPNTDAIRLQLVSYEQVVPSLVQLLYSDGDFPYPQDPTGILNDLMTGSLTTMIASFRSLRTWSAAGDQSLDISLLWDWLFGWFQSRRMPIDLYIE